MLTMHLLGLNFRTTSTTRRAMPSETGVIDLVGFLKVLREIGYDGPVSPEPFNPRLKELPAEQAVRETHEALETAWQAAGV